MSNFTKTALAIIIIAIILVIGYQMMDPEPRGRSVMDQKMTDYMEYDGSKYTVAEDPVEHCNYIVVNGYRTTGITIRYLSNGEPDCPGTRRND